VAQKLKDDGFFSGAIELGHITRDATEELKVADFNHEHLGQLNTYVSWYKRNMTTDGDCPPIGLLLCKRKDNALVHYALADLPNTLFVSKYQVELPTLEQLRDFLNAPATHQRPRAEIPSERGGGVDPGAT
jgi:hypothetical protein